MLMLVQFVWMLARARLRPLSASTQLMRHQEGGGGVVWGMKEEVELEEGVAERLIPMEVGGEEGRRGV